MLIGELADRAGTTVKAVRYYERRGLLHPRRAANGYRHYDESAVGRVGNIRLLLSLGLTTDDVRSFLPCLDLDVAGAILCPASADVITRRLSEVEEKIADLDGVRQRLLAALKDTQATPATRS
ncbi:MerR family transcriptional regulator [Actinomadura sp. KC06]|uniref:MerR family transcriptional regulator n=1 Tax=Actinomadura sp. KC06 TaxID=2530369 RepID=UPI0010523305|nr:MerR family transcriptional regulator [Actinomadura sp. KC06]TDD21191.1 MerR family transcriptional regulator [Actinomadura sp. KC06]